MINKYVCNEIPPVDYIIIIIITSSVLTKGFRFLFRTPLRNKPKHNRNCWALLCCRRQFIDQLTKLKVALYTTYMHLRQVQAYECINCYPFKSKNKCSNSLSGCHSLVEYTYFCIKMIRQPICKDPRVHKAIVHRGGALEKLIVSRYVVATIIY